MGTLAPELAFLPGAPLGMGRHAYCMGLGERAGARYPRNARIQLRDEHPGMELASLLGNTDSFLVVSSAMRRVIEQHTPGVDMEILPFDLHDHRGRLHSRDHAIVNPIGTRDCLDEAASDLIVSALGGILIARRFVLDPGKVEGAPSLFRIGGSPGDYVVDARLARAFLSARFTNVRLTPLEVSGS